MRVTVFALGIFALAACAVVRTNNERTGVTREALGTPMLVTTIGSPPPGVTDPGVVARNALFARVGGGSGKVVFVGSDNAHGNELWTTDGTAAGTVLVRDILPGPQSSVSTAVNFAFALTGDNTGIFFATDGSHGVEPWRTDGTTAGTYPLGDFVPGSAGFTSYRASRVGNAVFIIGTSSAGTFLYKTDGTVAGTVKVATASFTSNLVDANGTLYFQSTGGLWKSDGTDVGTVRVCPACASISITDMEAVGDKVFYSSGSFGKAGELWVSDGTPAGTQKLQSWTQDGAEEMTAAGGKLFFRTLANNSPTGYSGLELWTSDGTSVGTTFVYAVSYQTGTLTLNEMVAVGSSVYFLGGDSAHGVELWTSDGTSVGTRVVKDINPGVGSGLDIRVGPVPFGSGVLFAANDGTTGVEPWYSDGTADGTVLLADITPGANKGSSAESFFAADATTAYFQANNGLWKTTGPAGATTEVLPAAKTVNPPVAAAPLGNDHLFFAVDDGVSGTEPWITDGTPGGTQKITDIAPGNLPGYITQAVNYNGLVYFDGWFPTKGGNTLWRTNGTAGGTSIVDGGSETLQTVDNLAVVAGRLFFTVGGLGVNAPFAYTEAGGAVRLGSAANARDPIAYHGDILFFSTGGVFKSDGTAAGTTVLAPLNAGLPSPVLFHDRVYFANSQGTSGIELWSTDGTAAGTKMEVDVNPTGEGLVQNLTVVGDTLFFTGQNKVGTLDSPGVELWKSDGTTAGTVQVKDIYPGTKSSNPHRLAAAGGKLVFYADDATGMHVFVSDGTEAGTIVVTDAIPATSEKVNNLALEKRLWSTLPGAPILFPASNGDGAEWWISDGTAAGTSEWANLSLGPTSADPQLPTFVGNRLFFTGYANGAPAIYATTWDAPIPDAGIVIPPNTSSSSTSSSGGSSASSSSTGGTTGTSSSGGVSADGGNATIPGGSADTDTGGCGCRTTSRGAWGGDLALLAITLLALRRRRSNQPEV